MGELMLKNSPDVCPFCSSRNCEWGRIDINGNTAEQRASCNICESEWVEVYNFAMVWFDEALVNPLYLEEEDDNHN